MVYDDLDVVWGVKERSILRLSSGFSLFIVAAAKQERGGKVDALIRGREKILVELIDGFCVL